jgi:hypothetical protein
MTIFSTNTAHYKNIPTPVIPLVPWIIYIAHHMTQNKATSDDDNA